MTFLRLVRFAALLLALLPACKRDAARDAGVADAGSAVTVREKDIRAKVTLSVAAPASPELDAACESLRQMKKRGIRVLPGGDYGFAWAPHGTNAMDLEYFVKYVGFTPMEAILSATKLGGEIMMRPGELGVVRAGALADLLLVDGDPLANLAVLRDKSRLLAIVKDGKFHKAPEVAARPVHAVTA